MPGCLVTRHAGSVVFKQGRRVNIDERPALELAAQHGLPVPRVYDAGESDGEAFIQMDFVQGDRLDRVWPQMTAEERNSICRQLREILARMRSIPCKTGLIGSCSGGKAQDDRQYSHYSDGPYADEAAFNSSFYLDLLESTPTPIRTALCQQVRSDHRIVFTHGDLAQHNILVKDGQITGLLDWENAGWYPEHWDYIKFFERPFYDNELACHQAIIRWQNP
ncbi:hypothetical protein ACEQ8H_005074 [Pleosporales sp. CAS-2024a]